MGKLLQILFLSFFLAGNVSAQTGIEFQELEWTEALETAKKQGKLLFVSAYVEWSEPCQEIEKYTYTDKEVGEFFNENFINIRLDMEAFPGMELTEYYKVYAFPALLFVNHFGEAVHRGCGALESEELLALGKEALGENRLMDYQKKFTDKHWTKDFLIEYSYLLEQSCMSKDDFVRDFFKEVPQDQWTGEAAWTMINLNVSDPYSEQFQYLMDYQDKFSLKYGKDTVDQKIYEVLLDQFITIYQDGDYTLFAVQALKQMMGEVSFKQKETLSSMVSLKYAELTENWTLYGESAVKVVKEQEVTDPDQLNEFAWKFYLFISNKEQLEKARDWMKTVINEYADATYLDSYASILYKLGDQKGAIKFEEKALQAAKFEQQDLMHYEAQIDKFENGY